MSSGTIEIGTAEDIGEVHMLLRRAKRSLDENRIFQWTKQYPSEDTVSKDISEKTLFTLKKEGKIVATITLNKFQYNEYQSVDWQHEEKTAIIMHRLAVHPNHQKSGCAKELLDFADSYAKEQGCESIRLDVYVMNKRAIALYKTCGYVSRGFVSFPEREFRFNCMEKSIAINEG